MNETITFSKSAFARMLDDLLYPNPDDPGPYGPIGPVIRDYVSWVLLNPQPLPPRWEPNPDPWRIAGLTRVLIDRVVSQYQFAEVLSVTDQSERAQGTVQSYIRDVVDDWCGTRPPKWPWPWPPRFDPATLRPVDLLIAGAQFQKAASLDNPLQGDFSAAADRLFETAFKRMESR